TALACLYAIIPDPLEMLRALMPKVLFRFPLDWLVLSQLYQPFTEDEHADALTQVLKNLSVAFQLGALRSLSLHGGENMAASIADRLLVGHPEFSNLPMNNQANELDLSGLSSRALSLHHLGTYYHLAGDRDQALSLYTAAETTLEQWLAGLYLQRINLRAGENEDEAGVMMGCGQLSSLASAAGWLKNELGVALVSHPYASSVIDQLPGDQDSPFLALKRAALMSASEPALARDLARRASQEILAEIGQCGLPFSGEFIYSWRPQETLNILLDLGLDEEALSLAQAMLETRPVDLELLHLNAHILQRLGKPAEALTIQQTVVALEPANPAWRRALASLWAQTGDWRSSFSERQLVLSLTPQSDIADRLACALAALKSGALEEASALSEAILAEDANNGAALGIIGETLIGQGEAQSAMNYLVRATLLCPEILGPWLALADIQRSMGETQRALETLRAAVTALPEEPEAHLAFGEACSQMGHLAEGLPYLKKAFLLSSETAQAALLYGQALRRLGHTTDARSVLERVRSKWVSKPELAYEYAQVLLDQNDAESALPVLESALRNGLPILDGYLLYAKILLGEYRTSEENWDAAVALGRMQQADHALRRILEIEPGNLEARFLRADILREKGDLEEALAAYRQLAELPETE
ncbi:MAG: tetratricopeptide repeat protein, partial [Anaerolineaceae bacterium]|nr:tetratricopeptide repeat protein [Anaerolineaceae bacterium]